MVYFKNTLFFAHCAGLDWCGQSEDMIWRQYGKGYHILASYLGLVIMVVFTAAGGYHMFGITRGREGQISNQ